jgi:Nucleotidyltransferase domain
MEVVDDYLAELTRRMQQVLGDELVAVYAGGSYAMGAYRHGPSDIDVTAVVERPLSDETKQALVDVLRHEALPCPARGLELVVYPRAIVETATAEPGFELNLNTGARMDFRADFAPGQIEGFWFAIDRSIIYEHGKPFHGPPPQELFAPMPRDMLAPLLAESMRAQGNQVNLARSQHFLDTGQWISKRDVL